MKLRNATILLAIMFLLSSTVTMAQKTFYIHEDIVKPSKIDDYEAALKDLMVMVNKHQLQNVNWLAISTNNSHYFYVSEIKNMADLDKPSLGAMLVEKESKDAVGAIFDRLDECYDIELNYTMNYSDELSYIPEGATTAPEDETFRKYHMLYVTPSNRDAVKESLKAIKELYKSKGSKEYFRVYKSGFGTQGEYYMVSIAATDAAHYEIRSKENDDLLGEAGAKAIAEMYRNLLKYEAMIATIRKDISYSKAE
jgi:hypothetical protein